MHLCLLLAAQSQHLQQGEDRISGNSSLLMRRRTDDEDKGWPCQANMEESDGCDQQETYCYGSCELKCKKGVKLWSTWYGRHRFRCWHCDEVWGRFGDETDRWALIGPTTSPNERPTCVKYKKKTGSCGEGYHIALTSSNVVTDSKWIAYVDDEDIRNGDAICLERKKWDYNNRRNSWKLGIAKDQDDKTWFVKDKCDKVKDEVFIADERKFIGSHITKCKRWRKPRFFMNKCCTNNGIGNMKDMMLRKAGCGSLQCRSYETGKFYDPIECPQR